MEEASKSPPPLVPLGQVLLWLWVDRFYYWKLIRFSLLSSLVAIEFQGQTGTWLGGQAILIKAFF